MSEAGRSNLPRSVRPRSFGLLDAMILVLASATSFGGIRFLATQEQEGGWTFYGGPAPSGEFFWLMAIRGWLALAIPILGPITFTQVIIRVRRPRPPMTRVMNQPGVVACLGVSSILVYLLLHSLTRVAIRSDQQWMRSEMRLSFFQDENLLYEMGGYIALAGVVVIASWLMMMIGGRWRPERGWIDRLGRGLGIAWMATVPL